MMPPLPPLPPQFMNGAGGAKNSNDSKKGKGLAVVKENVDDKEENNDEEETTDSIPIPASLPSATTVNGPATLGPDTSLPGGEYRNRVQPQRHASHQPPQVQFDQLSRTISNTTITTGSSNPRQSTTTQSLMTQSSSSSSSTGLKNVTQPILKVFSDVDLVRILSRRVRETGDVVQSPTQAQAQPRQAQRDSTISKSDARSIRSTLNGPGKSDAKSTRSSNNGLNGTIGGRHKRPKVPKRYAGTNHRSPIHMISLEKNRPDIVTEVDFRATNYRSPIRLLSEKLKV